MRLERALVVEDDAALAREVAVVLARLGAEVRVCGDLVSAEAVLEAWRPDLLLLDFCLPDGRADQLVELLHRAPPFPATVAMSARAATTEAFRLGTLGIREFLQKPFRAAELEEVVRRAMEQPPDPLPHVRAAVGHLPLKDVESRVRRTMVDEAMRRSDGSRRGAARLLGVSRQFVQHVLRRLDDS